MKYFPAEKLAMLINTMIFFSNPLLLPIIITLTKGGTSSKFIHINSLLSHAEAHIPHVSYSNPNSKWFCLDLRERLNIF